MAESKSNYLCAFRKLAKMPALLDLQVWHNFGMPHRLPWMEQGAVIGGQIGGGACRIYHLGS
jgi:hypothetical protein